MEYIAEVYGLTEQFFADYPHDKYPEILSKSGRPYSCLLIDCMDKFLICIPFRSHIQHPYAYHFKNSVRSKRANSGLDYTKSVLIANNAYINTASPAIVDKDEYNETMINLPRIVREELKYITDYKNDLNNICKLHPSAWQRRYAWSTLPYFDELLRD